MNDKIPPGYHWDDAKRRRVQNPPPPPPARAAPAATRSKKAKKKKTGWQFEQLCNKLTKMYDVDILCGYSLCSVEVGMDNMYSNESVQSTQQFLRVTAIYRQLVMSGRSSSQHLLKSKELHI